MVLILSLATATTLSYIRQTKAPALRLFFILSRDKMRLNSKQVYIVNANDLILRTPVIFVVVIFSSTLQFSITIFSRLLSYCILLYYYTVVYIFL